MIPGLGFLYRTATAAVAAGIFGGAISRVGAARLHHCCNRAQQAPPVTALCFCCQRTLPRYSVPAPRRQLATTMSTTTDERPKVILISGPTAVGKSALSMRLCKRLDGEIISVDSVQVYRHLDVGSNKPSEEERREVPHHLIDVAEPNDTQDIFTAGRFLDRAESAVEEVWSRGKLPIIVGGTSMYTEWLVQGKPDAPKSDPLVDRRVEEMLAPFQKNDDWDGALGLLLQRNPERATRISRNDWFRLGRALEVSLLSGEGAKTFTGERRRSRLLEAYDLRCFFLVAQREELCRVIDQRCTFMLRSGLVEETANLLVEGLLDPASPPGRAIGYRQTMDYLCRPDPQPNDHKALVGYLEAFTTATRRYAKTQMTWFRAQRDFVWVRRRDLQDGGSLEEAEEEVLCGYQEGREAHEERKGGSQQARLREENLQEGKKMKTYRTHVALHDVAQELMDRADRCTALVQDKYRKPRTTSS